MLSKEYQVTIQVLAQQGMSARGIARELGIARQTVLDVLQGRSDGQYGPRKPRVLKLDPFCDYLAKRLKQAAPQRLAATALLREIQEQGYDGGISRLKVLLSSLRPETPSEPVIRFETKPGEQMQIDFVVFRRGGNPLRAFTASLGYSRMSYVHFTDNERAETWAAGIESAFTAFGGVPMSILCDNSKSMVIERNAYGKGKHRMHQFIWDLAKHYGVRIYLCRPYRAQTKGKVERFHRYLRESFFVPVQSRLGSIPLDVTTANHEVEVWLKTVANCRVHATLKERPCNLFLHEKEVLRPLPMLYQGKTERTLESDNHARKSVPLPIESYQHPLSTYDTLARKVQG